MVLLAKNSVLSGICVFTCIWLHLINEEKSLAGTCNNKFTNHDNVWSHLMLIHW